MTCAPTPRAGDHTAPQPPPEALAPWGLSRLPAEAPARARLVVAMRRVALARRRPDLWRPLFAWALTLARCDAREAAEHLGVTRWDVEAWRTEQRRDDQPRTHRADGPAKENA